MEPIISFSSADIVNGESIVIYGLDMEVRKGDFVYLVGKVGSGKTSIIRTMTAENPLKKGEGKVCGYDLRKIKPREIPYLRRKLGIVFQDFQLLTDRNVFDNLSFVLKSTGWKDKKLIHQKIFQVLGMVGMDTKGYKMPHELSGGEQQRICIARALLNDPKLILADEPTGNLDPETGRQIMEILHKVGQSGTTILMITHNLQWIQEYPGRVFKCEGRKLIIDAEPHEEQEEEKTENN